MNYSGWARLTYPKRVAAILDGTVPADYAASWMEIAENMAAQDAVGKADRSISRADLTTLAPEKVVELKQTGRLDHLLGR